MNVVLLPLFCVHTAHVLGHRPGGGIALGLMPTALFLVEGTLFWWMKWRQCRGLPVPAASRYREAHDRARRLNLVVLTACALGIAYLFAFTAAARRADAWWGVGNWLFGCAEHINYFHWQLMHQRLADFSWVKRHRRLKRGVAWRERYGRMS